MKSFWLEPFSENWNQREENNSQNKKCEIFLNHFKSSEEVSCIDEERRSQKSSNNIEWNEVEVFHFSNPCYEWGKSPYNRDKSCIDDRLPSMFVEEMLRFIKIFLFDKFFSEFGLCDFWTKEFSDFVIHTIS